MSKNSSNSWPIASNYAEMLQTPHRSFRRDDLKNCEITTFPDTKQPRARVGAFAVVYQAHLSNGQRLAIRVFTSQRPEIGTRYLAISEYLASQRHLDSLVAFRYEDEGICVEASGERRWFPVVTMEWVPGSNLFEWVREKSLDSDSHSLRKAADRWLELINELAAARIAHGSLSHDNILVTPEGDLKLVDYDSMCVPSLVGEANLEIGVDPYEHPGRDSNTCLSLDLDNFPALFIFVVLRALAAKPNLWYQYVEQRNYDKLLIHAEDFQAPNESDLFREFQASPDQEVARLSKILFDLYRSPIKEVRLLQSYLDGDSAGALEATHRKNLFVFLLDQSYSMEEPFGGDIGSSKQDELAAAVNAWIQEMILIASSEEGMGEGIDIAVIGYRTDQIGNPIIESAFVGVDDPGEICSLADLGVNPARARTVTQQTCDEETGEVQEVASEAPVWVDAKAEGGTPTCTVLHHTHGIISRWIEEHPTGYPPVVVHITDGESLEGDPVPYAEPIKHLATEHGNVLLFNCHLSMMSADSFVFPHRDEKLPDDFARTLFRMSSELPKAIFDRLRSEQQFLLPGARGMVFDADRACLSKFLHMCLLFQGQGSSAQVPRPRLAPDAVQPATMSSKSAPPRVSPESSVPTVDEVFISYSRRDEPQVMQLVERLRQEGVSIWIDRDGIDGATVWSEEIVEAIDRCRVLILMASQESVRSESVVSEVSLAAGERKKILPLYLEPLKMPNQLRLQLARFQYIEMYSGNEEDTFRRLMRALERLNVTKS